MKNISIYSFIHTIFFIALIAILSTFVIFIQLDNDKFKLNRANEFTLIANNFFTLIFTNPTSSQLTNLSKELNLKILNDTKLKLKILNQAEIIFKKETPHSRVRVFELNDNNYIYIQMVGYNLMCKINNKQHYNLYIAFIVFIIILLVIIFLYISLLNKLKPLKRLYRGIEEFKKGDLNINIYTESSDEIGKITTSFNQAILNINQLIESKNLFMRSIIHELKTPITKGLFSVSMLDIKENDKEELKNIFNTINNIITQLSYIEKFKNSTLQISKETLNLKQLIIDAIQLLDFNLNDIELELEQIKIIANKELFLVVLKNLIQNGIKYKAGGKLIICSNKNNISIKTKGSKLSKPLEYYIQPFVQEKKNSQGFGLGLYIVSEILKIHQFTFEYNYEDSYNIFLIKFMVKS